MNYLVFLTAICAVSCGVSTASPQPPLLPELEAFMMKEFDKIQEKIQEFTKDIHTTRNIINRVPAAFAVLDASQNKQLTSLEQFNNNTKQQLQSYLKQQDNKFSDILVYLHTILNHLPIKGRESYYNKSAETHDTEMQADKPYNNDNKINVASSLPSLLKLSSISDLKSESLTLLQWPNILLFWAKSVVVIAPTYAAGLLLKNCVFNYIYHK